MNKKTIDEIFEKKKQEKDKSMLHRLQIEKYLYHQFSFQPK